MAKNPKRKKSSPLDNLAPLPRYVSRGGEKLRGALERFTISVTGKTCLDVGSSTGGFTDCLLQAGAQAVWAVDVGYGLIDYRLRKDPRVRLLERTNFRFLERTAIPDPIELAVIDVSFISLSKILPKLFEFLNADGEAIVLAKLQFEGTPKEVPGGVIKDEAVRQSILARVETAVRENRFELLGKADSEIKGRKGNQETFLYLKKAAA